MTGHHCPTCGSSDFKQETQVILSDFGFQVMHWMEEIWRCLGCKAIFSQDGLEAAIRK